MLKRTCAPTLLLGLVLCAACVGEPASSVTSWRVRADDQADLNDRVSWAAAAGSEATIEVDRRFRVRFAVRGAGDADLALRLEARRNEGPWMPLEALDHPYPDGIASSVTSIVTSREYAHGEATEAVLTPAGADFAGGSGVSLRPEPRIRSWPSGVTEWEWTLVIRYFSDGALRIDDGDRFEYRLVERDGVPLPGSPARVVVSVPDGHLGGTFVETPGRIGPWQTATGDLYFVQEPAETDNVFMMVKSTDGGRSWAEVDGENRPPNGDLESVAGVQVGEVIHLVHQADSVWHYSFNMAGHADAPDSWAIRDELISGALDPATQSLSLAARADGRLIAAYSADADIRLRQRSADGEWGKEIILAAAPDAEAVLGPALEVDAGGTPHLAWVDTEARAWHTTLDDDATPSTPRVLASDLPRSETELIAVLPLVALDGGGIAALWRRADGRLMERRWRGGSWTPARIAVDASVAAGEVDSDQTTADVIAHGDDLHLLFAESGTGALWYTHSVEGNAWSAPVHAQDGIDAQWVRGAMIAASAGGALYGYVVDTGSEGGSGMNRYGTIPLGR